MHAALDRVLQAARQLGASDVHLKAGLPPIFRIKGDLRTVRDVPPLSREVVQEFAFSMMNDRLRDSFERTWDVDLAYSTQDGARYRVNVFQQRGNVGMVLRLIPPDVPPFEKLNLPRAAAAPGRRGAGAGAGHRHHRLGQVDHAGGDGRLHQRHPGRAHRDHRGSGRVRLQGPQERHQPARGRVRHDLASPRRCAPPCGRIPT